jgi:hypothetical protein
MKYLNSLFVIILSSFIFSGNAAAHVSLIYPLGGETFQAENVVTIQWRVDIYHGPSNWDLFFSRDGGSTWETIVMNLQESQLTYDWTVPNIDTDSAQVRVIQDNETGQDYPAASGNFTINTVTSIEMSGGYFQNFILLPPYPNPFNSSTTIRYELYSPSRVSLKIFNILGEEIKTLVNNNQTPGLKSVVWNGRDNRSQVVGSGIYVYSLQVGNQIKSMKVFLTK